MQKSRNKQQLLYNTITHFNSKNRCTLPNGIICQYRVGTNACAIGRELDDELAEKLDGIHKNISDKEVFSQLPIRLQNMGAQFLRDIQRLHDDKSNWIYDGLSVFGEKRVARICEKHNLDLETLQYH
jgi:hypothetical protein